MKIDKYDMEAIYVPHFFLCRHYPFLDKVVPLVLWVLLLPMEHFHFHLNESHH